MPSTSQAQHRYFEWIAHDPHADPKKMAVARDFVEADKGRNLKRLPEKKAGKLKPSCEW